MNSWSRKEEVIALSVYAAVGQVAKTLAGSVVSKQGNFRWVGILSQTEDIPPRLEYRVKLPGVTANVHVVGATDWFYRITSVTNLSYLYKQDTWGQHSGEVSLELSGEYAPQASNIVTVLNTLADRKYFVHFALTQVRSFAFATDVMARLFDFPVVTTSNGEVHLHYDLRVYNAESDAGVETIDVTYNSGYGYTNALIVSGGERLVVELDPAFSPFNSSRRYRYYPVDQRS